MAKIEANISVSVDGFVTGPHLDRPPGRGEGGEILHAWIDEERGLDFAIGEGRDIAGAVITSRKVYDETGGWGTDGFFRMPVFVVTHRPHDVVVKGDTTFTFVTGGVEDAVAQAVAAAKGRVGPLLGGGRAVPRGPGAGRLGDDRLLGAPRRVGVR